MWTWEALQVEIDANVGRIIIQVEIDDETAKTRENKRMQSFLDLTTLNIIKWCSSDFFHQISLLSINSYQGYVNL